MSDLSGIQKIIYSDDTTNTNMDQRAEKKDPSLAMDTVDRAVRVMLDNERSEDGYKYEESYIYNLNADDIGPGMGWECLRLVRAVIEDETGYIPTVNVYLVSADIIYDNEKNIYIFGMICDTKNEEDVTYLKVRPFLMDGPNDMRTIRCTFDAKKAASKLTRGDVCIVKVCEDVGNPAKSDAIKFYSPYDTSLYASLYIISGESIKYISIGKPVSQALCPNGSLCLSIDENNRKKNILFTPSKRQVALSNILVALEENRILAVFHKGKDGMQVNVM